MMQLLALLVGAAIGFLATLIGVGGGVFAVPAFYIVFGLSMQEAIGTSMLVIVVSSIPALYIFARSGKVRWKIALILESCSIPGVLLGAAVSHVVPQAMLAALFAVLLIYTAYRVVKSKEPGNGVGVDRSSMRKAGLLSFAAGIVSGLLGVGGGWMKVPIMLIALGMGIHEAIATQRLMVLVTGAAGTASHALLGHVNLEVGLPVALGAAIGGYLGSKVALKAESRVLRRLFAAILVLMAVTVMARSAALPFM